MRKALSYIAACLLVYGCIDRGSVKPTSFTIGVDEVHGTSVTFTIHPGDERAWYAYTLLNEYFENSYGKSDAEIAEDELEVKLLSFENYYGQQENNLARFSDIFCYKGTRTFTEKFLIPDCSYRIVVFQIDPYKRVLNGGKTSGYLQTRDVLYADTEFELQFSGDTLRIIPSDPHATYFWDCNSAADIEEEFGDRDYYFRSLVYMYQEYHFMENLLRKGTLEWVFSRDDKSIREGDRRTVMVAGYSDGELNTPVTSTTFVYHKDGIKPDDDWEEAED